MRETGGRGTPRNSQGVRQASEGRDVVSVRVALHAILLFRDFPNVFP